MAPIGRNVRKRNKDKSAVTQARMRQNRRATLDAAIIVDQIEIKRARRVPLRTLTPETFLRRMQKRHEFRGRKFRVDARNGIYKRRIRGIGPCFGDVIR